MDAQRIDKILLSVYNKLLEYYGPQHWWPAQEPFEVIVGAILTQSTAWINVEKAIVNLKAANAISPVALRQLTNKELAVLIRSCGYFNVKTQRLKAFAGWLGNQYNDDLGNMFAADIKKLRHQLLGVDGIGEETADSILLYAGDRPTFVIDAYTRRIIDRLGLSPADRSYHGYQALFMKNLPADAGLFNEYHALFVRHGKESCRKNPLCQKCSLRLKDKKTEGEVVEYPCDRRDYSSKARRSRSA
jgi:endonuclease-3 related protein